MLYYVQKDYQNVNQIFTLFETVKYSKFFDILKDQEKISSESQIDEDNFRANNPINGFWFGYSSYRSLREFSRIEGGNFFNKDDKYDDSYDPKDNDPVFEFILNQLNREEKSVYYLSKNRLTVPLPSQQDFQNLFVFHKKILLISKKLKLSILEANCLNNLGELYFTQENFQEALNQLKKSLVILNNINKYNINSTTSFVINNLGRTHHAFGQFQQAINYYKQSIL